jgi:hypothetical protein
MLKIRVFLLNINKRFPVVGPSKRSRNVVPVFCADIPNAFDTRCELKPTPGRAPRTALHVSVRN